MGKPDQPRNPDGTWKARNSWGLAGLLALTVAIGAGADGVGAGAATGGAGGGTSAGRSASGTQTRAPPGTAAPCGRSNASSRAACR